MTFTEIVLEIADRLNLTSESALNRIGRSVNERYKWAVSSIGLATSMRDTAESTTVIGEQTLTFPDPTETDADGVVKLYDVFDATVSPSRALKEWTVAEIRRNVSAVDPTQQYAIWRVGAASVTILLGSVPTTNYTLTADVEVSCSTLSAEDVPSFPEEFHNLLIYGGMATELEKMEKYQLAEKQETKFMIRLSDLRMFIAKSGTLDIVQGKSHTHRSWRLAPFSNGN